METTSTPANHPRIVSEKELTDLNSILTELSITETNAPAAPTKPTRVTSFGGRVRVATLTASDAEKWIDKVITVGGWVRSLREGGNKEFCFIDLNDGSTIKNLQIVVLKEVSNFAELIKEGIGSCLQLRGLIVKSPGNKQPIEMRIENKEDQYARIVGKCKQGDYPLMVGKEAKKMKLETLRDLGHLRPRTNIISSVTRIRNNLAYATHIYFQNRGFQYIHTPLITASDCEGAGSMFQVTTLLPKPSEKMDVKTTTEGKVDYKNDFFGKPSYLTVSGQLAVENYACALSDVYTFGPTFRAEWSHTSRHLAEFWMIEPEMCFADIYDDMECGENYLKFCLKYVLENNKEDLEFLDKQVEKGLIQRLKNVTENDFKRLPYTEAIEILKKAVEKDKKLFVEELTKEEKAAIAKAKKEAKEAKKKANAEKKAKKQQEQQQQQQQGEGAPVTKVEEQPAPVKVEEQQQQQPAKKEEQPVEKVEEKPKEDLRNIYWGMDMASQHERYLTEEVFKMPVIVYNYPKEIKSFYMKLNPDNKTVAAMDILVPRIGEIIGGSQREEDFEKLSKRIEELKMDLSGYWWYLDLRKFGTVPHAGFGLGFERLVMMATGIDNIRDVIPYPRYPGHAEF
jgi:asparaginyl-tRNA synthetase